MSPEEHTPTKPARRIPTFWYAGRPAALYIEALSKRRRTSAPSSPAVAGHRRATGRVQNSVALVTGAGRGIGRLVAQRLASSGYVTALVARSHQELDETARLIEQSGGESVTFQADVRDEHAAGDMAAYLGREIGPIDLLVNNAGVLGPIGPAWEVEMQAWWETVEINLLGTLLYTQTILPGMVDRGRGRIINVTSQAGAFRWPIVSAYSVSKAAVIKLTENVAHEARRHGVSVFSIHPGLLPIGLGEAAFDPTARPGPDEARIMAWARQEIAEGRGANPDRAIDQLMRLASGRYDALSGRHVSVHDDLDQVTARIDHIRQNELYVLGVQGLAA
jgi:NAD(P)-dependent dehydrogenase (short-subunit alcohol dehydrogenase family)